MAEGTRTVVDILVEDHREIEDLFQQIEASDDAEHVRRLADAAIAELVRHSVAEEQYLYPAIREHLSDGHSIADHELVEHAEAERVMKELEGMDAHDPEFRPTLDRLMSDIRHHVQDEENGALPDLAEACSTATLGQLGHDIEQAKNTAPTRPHPGAPDKPPMNKILAPGAGLVDRIRDAVTGRPHGPG
ncbi:hemerythrin HHE cation binding domain-containing protein [Haloactinopolyspora alba]|uniref:Hemerythrin HHE cation binding domain-containing protein n=1 Tax=Haloactinopolyspora alba TaxID=648780 RepID=A0A2P8D3W7_9ACTN|nr:hemerythrin domain-containing protein [Haloactinopolyspora alba]PSK91902.1 hemerythrin HHE cation binding domain-containing protein [Haloactinopolyspora alba]